MNLPAGCRGGRLRVVDADKHRAILARHAEGQSLREIYWEVGVSLAVVGFGFGSSSGRWASVLLRAAVLDGSGDHCSEILDERVLLVVRRSCAAPG